MNSQAEWLGFELSDAQLLVLMKVCAVETLPGVHALRADERAIDHAWRELAQEGMIWNAAGSLQAHYLLAGLLHTASNARRILELRALGESFTVYEDAENFVCLLRRRSGSCMLIPARTRAEAWHLTSSFAKAVDGHAAVKINGKSVGRLGAEWKTRLEGIWSDVFDEARQNKQ